VCWLHKAFLYVLFLLFIISFYIFFRNLLLWFRDLYTFLFLCVLWYFFSSFIAPRFHTHFLILRSHFVLLPISKLLRKVSVLIIKICFRFFMASLRIHFFYFCCLQHSCIFFTLQKSSVYLAFYLTYIRTAVVVAPAADTMTMRANETWVRVKRV
jgi:hypothetical protein